MTNVLLHELARPWLRLPIVTVKYGLAAGLAAIAFTLLYLSLAFFDAPGFWILLLWAGLLVVLAYSPARERLMRHGAIVATAVFAGGGLIAFKRRANRGSESSPHIGGKQERGAQRRRAGESAKH
jgi:hypothetical protein